LSDRSNIKELVSLRLAVTGQRIGLLDGQIYSKRPVTVSDTDRRRWGDH